MGRPPIGKKAMTPAERQKRRRKRLGRERKRAEIDAKRTKNHAKFLASEARQPDWTRVNLIPAAPPLDAPADELVDQLLEAIQLSPEITLSDIQAAITRRIAGS